LSKTPLGTTIIEGIAENRSFRGKQVDSPAESVCIAAPTRHAGSLEGRPARHAGIFLAGLTSLLIGGCAVGPNFKTPAAPAVSGYADHPLSATVATPNVAGGEAQRFAAGSDIPGDWWTLFRSQPLNALIEQTLANNHDLKAAQAALTVARENTRAQRGAFFPSVSTSFSATRQRQSGDLAPTPNNNAFEYSLFTPQVSVSYVPDVFGLTQRTVESAKAQEEAIRYQTIAARMTLINNVAAAAFQDASLNAQIDATRQLIEINTKLVDILKYQSAKGYAGGLEVAAQQSQLAQVRAALPPLLKQSAQQHDLIAVLAGRYPGQAPSERFDIATLTLPQELPVSLPSTLVEQRPDVLQAQANLHAASAQIGVAEANRLPNIQLTGNAGSTALAIGNVFKSGTGFWAAGAAATSPIFQGGQLLHQERGAKAAYIQAAEQYRSTVLTAFQNVADTLAAIEQDAETLKAAAAASDAAKVTLDLSERQWRAGYASYLSLLSAEQAYQQTRIALVQAQASRFVDTAVLFQALGGGWWRGADLAKDRHAN
jgi:NodT family efflux transporter outer membrane factor (OMF) lipoprotein